MYALTFLQTPLLHKRFITYITGTYLASSMYTILCMHISLLTERFFLLAKMEHG